MNLKFLEQVLCWISDWDWRFNSVLFLFLFDTLIFSKGEKAPRTQPLTLFFSQNIQKYYAIESNFGHHSP